jgi:hypothetical protein
MAGQDGVHIHLFQVDAAIGNHALGHNLEVADARFGLFASVGFDQADHHIHALLVLHQVGVVEHVVGFAHARRGADVDAEFGGFLLAFQLISAMAQPTSTGWRNRLHGRHGKSEAEGGSMAQAALDGNLAAQRLDQPADQREPQAGAFSEMY